MVRENSKTGRCINNLKGVIDYLRETTRNSLRKDFIEMRMERFLKLLMVFNIARERLRKKYRINMG